MIKEERRGDEKMDEMVLSSVFLHMWKSYGIFRDSEMTGVRREVGKMG